MSESTSMTEDQEAFEYWLFEMDDALARFLERLPNSLRAELDFSIQSFDALEVWLLERYESYEELMAEPAQDDLDGATRYVGEAVRRAGGGRWRVVLDDPKYAFFGIPEVAGMWNGAVAPVCPMSLVTASVDRRSGAYIRQVVEGLQSSRV